MASEGQKRLHALGHQATLLSLRELSLPIFDNDRIYEDANVRTLTGQIRTADGVVLAAPVYNWSLGSAAKNMVEATGSNDESRALISPWFDRLVTFLVSGGVPQSYTAHAQLALSLMLDFRRIVNPYHLHMSSQDWEGDDLGKEASGKLDQTLRVMIELAECLRKRSYVSRWTL